MRLFSDSASSVDDPYLARACALALKGAGRTWPNPMVGCVIAAEGRIVGEGYHPRAGEPHAEVFALRDAGDAARGATAYVTLEPCSHHGRTPPCTDALISAGVGEVVIGMRDPSSEAGGGATALEAAGVRVVFAQDPNPFAELNAGWLKRLSTGLPFVTAKVGVSLDGRISVGGRQRSSITGASGSLVTSKLRASCDAVAVGSDTVAADDPLLTVRDGEGQHCEHQPLRVIVTRGAMPPESSRLLDGGVAETLILAPEERVSEVSGLARNARVEGYDASQELLGVLEALGRIGVNDVLFEPGRRLMTSLWDGRHIDRLVTVSAGGMAGQTGLEIYAGEGDARGNGLDHRFAAQEARVVGDVAVVSWRPKSGVDDPLDVKGTACSLD